MLSRVGHELAQHVVQDASVLEVGHLDLGVEPGNGLKAGAVVDLHCDGLADLNVAVVELDAEALLSGEAQGGCALSLLEDQGQDAHSD